MSIFGQFLGLAGTAAGTALGGPVGGAVGGALGGAVAGAVDGEGKQLPPSKQPATAGAHSSGWTGAAAGSTPAPVDPAPPSKPEEPATEPQEPRKKMDIVNQFLGTETGRIGTDIAGGFISDYRSQRNSRKNFSRLKKEGLTSVEIAGGGGASGAVSSQGNTLGSGPARQAASQQQFQREQSMLDRQNRKEVAEIGARAAGRQAGVAEGRFGLEERMAPKLRAQIDANLQRIKQQVKRAKFDLENIWEMKMAGMSMENGMFALAMASENVDIASALRGKATPQAIRKMENAIELMKKLQGRSGGLLGMSQFLEQVVRREGALGGKDGFPLLGTTMDRRVRTRTKGKPFSRGQGRTGSWKPGASGSW